MRIDKFLKLSRIIKRRSVAQDACDSQRILVNGKPAKPAKDIKVGDIIAVKFGDKTISFCVLKLDERPTKQTASEMYKIVEG